jgi:hypothetical protein
MNISHRHQQRAGRASVSTRLAAGFRRAAAGRASGQPRHLARHRRKPLPHLVEETVAGIRGEASRRRRSPRATFRRADRRGARRRPGGDRQPDVQFRHQLDAEDLVRPSAARPRHLPLHGEGAEGLLGDRKVVVIESRAGVYAGAGRSPGSAPAHDADLRGAQRPDLRARRRAGVREPRRRRSPRPRTSWRRSPARTSRSRREPAPPPAPGGGAKL